jgi:Ca-activated chloride channel family protein
VGHVTFATPLALLGLAALIPLALVFRRADRARRHALAVFGPLSVQSPASSLPRDRGTRLAHGLALACVALCVIALARPQLGTTSQLRRRTSGDILFALDLSRSMGAADVQPSRLDAAKRAAADIARAFPDDRVGLIVFGGSGFLQLPPTLDHSTFRSFLDAAATADIPDPSTNFEALAGLVTATLARSDAAPYSAVVMLSDGEDVEGKLEQAINLLISAHARTFAVGIGTPAGAVVTDRDARGTATPHLDWAGREVTSKLDEQNLRDIARRTGGDYAWWDGDASVEPIISELAQLQRRAVASTTHGPPADRFQWPLALACVLLVAYPLAARPRPVGPS